MKMANDVRLLASGPRAGIGELRIPENEPGSSIMPGKVNPTQSEAMTMVAVQVFGNDTDGRFRRHAGALPAQRVQAGHRCTTCWSRRLLADACRSFAEHCVAGLSPTATRIAAHLEDSLMLVTALAPHIGYEPAAAIARHAHREGRRCAEAANEVGGVTDAQFDEWVAPERMARPHR